MKYRKAVAAVIGGCAVVWSWCHTPIAMADPDQTYLTVLAQNGISCETVHCSGGNQSLVDMGHDICQKIAQYGYVHTVNALASSLDNADTTAAHYVATAWVDDAHAWYCLGT